MNPITEKKVTDSVGNLRSFEPPDGYYGSDSFGKDSCVIRELSKMAGVKVEWHHQLTTVDPPELIWFGKKYHPDTQIHRPELTMYQLMLKKHFPPYPKARYCCDILKERGGEGRWVLTGVRREESDGRKNRQVVEECYLKTQEKYVVNPILEWTSADVWQFLKSNNVPYCSLYDEGFERLGCVMCPKAAARNIAREAARWPKIAANYERVFVKMWIQNRQAGRKGGKDHPDGSAWFRHWMSKKKFERSGTLF